MPRRALHPITFSYFRVRLSKSVGSNALVVQPATPSLTIPDKLRLQEGTVQEFFDEIEKWFEMGSTASRTAIPLKANASNTLVHSFP